MLRKGVERGRLKGRESRPQRALFALLRRKNLSYKQCEVAEDFT